VVTAKFVSSWQRKLEASICSEIGNHLRKAEFCNYCGRNNSGRTERTKDLRIKQRKWIRLLTSSPVHSFVLRVP